MQKKFIALAITGLLSGAAFAQSNVTIYGAVDVSDVYANDSFKANTKTFNAIQSGSAGLNGSRLGFKGVEDLGNGLSANFRMEAGLNIDTGTSAQSGQLFGRWATVSLADKKLGEIQAGRRDTFQDQLLATASGTGRNSITQASSVYVDQSRINNFVAYLSPDWSGFQVKLGFSSQGTDPSSAAVTAGTLSQDVAGLELSSTNTNVAKAAAGVSTAGAVGATNSNLRVYAAAVNYTNGPLFVGAAYDYNKLQDLDSSLAGAAGDGSYKGGNVWNVAGAYDFGIVRFDAAIGKINYAGNTQLGEDKDSRSQWAVGAVVPFGASDRVMLNYAHAKIDYLNSNLHDDSLAIWGANYMHDFSKRTTVYAAYAAINQNNDNVTAYKASLYGTPTGYQQAVQVGVRHWF